MNELMLMIYYKNSRLDLVKNELEYGVDIHNYDDTALYLNAQYGHLNVVKYLVENGANQNMLFEQWNKQDIVKLFLEIDDCKPIKQRTYELCSESFELPKPDDWYMVWEDDSITIFENVHLASVEPELIKRIYIQC